MRTLYPPIKPYAEHMLEVEAPHQLYIEECGNSEGIPIVFVHGGPGAGCTLDDRCFFDPDRYRIVLFDQRGSGRSTPHASLENNTLPHLVSDMEKIRKHLKIDRWVLFGGSWGSTLSLAYAQAHTDRVLGLILRGIFLCRDQDIQWFYQKGASHVFPDYWETFVSLIPDADRHDMVGAYHKILTGDDELARMAAAKHWAEWEGACATLQPSKSVVSRFTNPHTAMSLARIEAHFFMNQSFLKPNQLVQEAHKLNGIPGVIVHGRYDMICPLDNAYDLQKEWKRAELQIVRDAGHSSMEPGITDALIGATINMAQLLE